MLNSIQKEGEPSIHLHQIWPSNYLNTGGGRVKHLELEVQQLCMRVRSSSPNISTPHMHTLLRETIDKTRQWNFHLRQRFHVRHRVRFVSPLSATLPDGLSK